MDTFGVKLSEARKKAGLTQTQLAKIIGVSERSVQFYEQGRSKPPFTKLKTIAETLGVSLAYFDSETTETTQSKRQGISPQEAEFLKWVEENLEDSFFYDFDKSPEESKAQMMADLRYLWERDKKQRARKEE